MKIISKIYFLIKH